MNIYPKVTVLMPVYNSADYLDESISSILNQTYTNFEFLIIDDGSYDGSVAIIKSYQDVRISLLCNEENRGIIYSLNRGLALAQGDYIARMDADDISLPERLAKQVEFLNGHPSVGVVGTGFQIIDDRGKVNTIQRFPSHHGVIRWSLCFFSPIVHPSVMIRKNVICRVGKYNATRQHAEDYDLWCRLAHITQLANLPDILLSLRKHSDNVSTTCRERQNLMAIEISRSEISMVMAEEVSSSLVQSLWNRKYDSAVIASHVADMIHRLMDIFIADEEVSVAEKRLIRSDAVRRISELIRPYIYNYRLWKYLLLVMKLAPVVAMKEILRIPFIGLHELFIK